MVKLMMTMISQMIQEQSTTNSLESKLKFLGQSMIQKIGQFNSEDIMGVLEVYENEMANKCT